MASIYAGKSKTGAEHELAVWWISKARRSWDRANYSWCRLADSTELITGDVIMVHGRFYGDDLIRITGISQQSIGAERVVNGERLTLNTGNFNHRGARSKCNYCIRSDKNKRFLEKSHASALENQRLAYVRDGKELPDWLS